MLTMAHLVFLRKKGFTSLIFTVSSPAGLAGQNLRVKPLMGFVN
jgi:hypothetical protein